ncbi:MAG: HD domain-containing protein [Myxococcota bacterium]
MRDALLEAFALKAVDRAGWVRAGVDGPESVAAHSWGISLLVLLMLPAGLDRERALVYAVLHDLAEAWVGDVTPHDDVPDKHAREDAAMVAFCERVARPDLLAAWRAYEAQADPEARFVKQLDRLDMGLQAALYSRQGLDLSEFLESALAGIDAPELRALL